MKYALHCLAVAFGVALLSPALILGLFPKSASAEPRKRARPTPDGGWIVEDVE